MDPITIKLPSLETGNERVPVVVGAVDGGVESDHSSGAGIVLPVEEE
jgi:hypothetical protein